MADELYGEGEAALLAAAELLGGGLQAQIAKADGGEGFGDAIAAEFGVAETQFFKDAVAAEVAFGELEDETGNLLEGFGQEGLVAPEDFACGGSGKASEDFEQGAFARTARADDEAELLGGEVEGDFFENGDGGGGGMVADVAQVKHC